MDLAKQILKIQLLLVALLAGVSAAGQFFTYAEYIGVPPTGAQPLAHVYFAANEVLPQPHVLGAVADVTAKEKVQPVKNTQSTSNVQLAPRVLGASSTLTDSQINAIIALLQSFGADSNVIASVQQDLSGETTVATSTKGVLTVQEDVAASLAYRLAYGGQINVKLAQLKFHASYEPINLTNLVLRLSNRASSSPSDLVGNQLKLWKADGVTQVGTITIQNGTYSGTTTSISGFTIPQDGDAVMIVTADLSNIGISQPGGEGHTIAVDYDGGNADGTRGVGLDSALTIYSSSYSNTTVASVGMYKSVPRVTDVTVNSLLAPNSDLYKFTISANPGSANGVYLHKVTFSIATSSAHVSGFRLYGPNGPVNAIAINRTHPDNISWNGMQVLEVYADAISPDRFIGGGQTKMYTLRADSVQYGSGTNSLTLRILGDEEVPPTDMNTFMQSAWRVDQAQYDNFIWSPQATTTVTASNNDFTNGHGVPVGVGMETLTNNMPARTFTYANADLPDLVVDSYSISPLQISVGNPVSVSMTIKNQGAAAAYNIPVLVDMCPASPLGCPVASTTISSLAAGSSVTLNLNSIYTPSISGQYDFGIMIDLYNAIPESNEANNQKFQSITVGAPLDDETLPAVSITYPTTSQTYSTGQVASVQASASDNVGISKVEFSDGPITYTDTSAPYEFSELITSSTPLGQHAWFATAYDYSGNHTTAGPRYFNVASAQSQQPPSILVTSPQDGSKILRSVPSTITWTSVNIAGPVTIDLWKNGFLYKTIAQNAPNTGSYVWTPNQVVASTVTGTTNKFQVIVRGTSADGNSVVSGIGYFFYIVAQLSFDYSPPQVLGASSSLSDSQIQAIISLLQSFGADSTVIANVQKALNGENSSSDSGTAWCHTFDANLSIGSGGSEVAALQKVLIKEGFQNVQGNYRGDKAIYDENTAAAVTGFQEKYRNEILAPNGLQYGTGFVGAATRKKLNQLYGCGFSPVPKPEPIPTPIPYPTLPVITGTGAKAAGNFEADAGGTLSIYGSHLGNPYAEAIQVFIGNQSAGVRSGNDNTITVDVPSSLVPGQSYPLYIVNKYGHSNTVTIKILSVLEDSPMPTTASLDLDGNGSEDGYDSNLLADVIVGNASCPAGHSCDLNGDGKVDAGDLLKYYFVNTPYDLNGDGAVTSADNEVLVAVIRRTVACPVGKICDTNGDHTTNAYDLSALNKDVSNLSCAAPSNLSPSGTITAAADGKINLLWSPAAGAAYYAVRLDDGTSDRYNDSRYQSCMPGGSPHYYCENGIVGTSITGVPVKAGRTYKYWVDAIFYPQRFGDACRMTTNITVQASVEPAALKIGLVSQSAASLAPQGTIVPFTNFVLSPSKSVVLKSLLVQRTGLTSDTAFKNVVLIANSSDPVSQKINPGQIVAYGWLDGSHTVTLVPTTPLTLDSVSNFTVAGVMAANNQANAGQVGYFTIVGGTYLDPSSQSIYPIQGSYPLTGVGQTVNSSLPVGSFYTEALDSGATLRITASNVESLSLRSVVLASAVPSVEVNGATSDCKKLEDTTNRVFCKFFPITIAKGSSVDIKIPQGYSASLASPFALEIYGQTYGYRADYGTAANANVGGQVQGAYTAAPLTASLTASRPDLGVVNSSDIVTLPAAGSVTLSWNAPEALQCTISNTNFGALGNSGSMQSEIIRSNTQFTLSCTDGDRTAQDSVLVSVSN